MAMSEVPPLTVWSPLAWIASFERLKKLLLAIWSVAFATRDVMVGVMRRRVVVRGKEGKVRLGELCIWEISDASDASSVMKFIFCCNLMTCPFSVPSALLLLLLPYYC